MISKFINFIKEEMGKITKEEIKDGLGGEDPPENFLDVFLNTIFRLEFSNRMIQQNQETDLWGFTVSEPKLLTNAVKVIKSRNELLVSKSLRIEKLINFIDEKL